MRLLEPWAGVERIRIISFTPDQTEQWIGGNYEFKMLVFGIGGELLFENKTLRILEMLRSRVPNTPLVVISDREDDHDVALAMSKGIQGYISSGINSGLAYQALSFILHGGMYFPLSAFRKLQVKPKEHDKFAPPFGTLNHEQAGMPAMRSVIDIVSKNNDQDIWSMLTSRQREVLEHIRQGESNKIIGRHLGMTEGTVKVHVRQIMRKVGANNRTQLAIGKAAHLKKVET
jgi:DNA-binding NarL/FixJ family response regulator